MENKKPIEKKPIEKKWFDVRIECLLPATITFRVLAEDAEKAAEISKTLTPNSVKYKLIGRKDIKLTVYEAGCTIIKYLRNIVR